MVGEEEGRDVTKPPESVGQILSRAILSIALEAMKARLDAQRAWMRPPRPALKLVWSRSDDDDECDVVRPNATSCSTK
jgi:hypothetical protein